MMFIMDVYEVHRDIDIDTVIFRADLDRTVVGASVAGLHALWCTQSRLDFECSRAEILKTGDDRVALFKFRAKPFSMESNEMFRYIRAFGKWVDDRYRTRTEPNPKPREYTSGVSSLLSRILFTKKASEV